MGIQTYFSGEYEGKLDAKHRLVMPAKIKSQLPPEAASTIAIARGFEPCLVMYPVTVWKQMLAAVMALSEFNEEHRQLQRNLFRGHTEIELDTMGRFIVPKTLLKHAQLDKEVMIVGVGNRVEIWNPAVYESFLIMDSAALSKLAEKHLGKDNKEQYKFIIHNS